MAAAFGEDVWHYYLPDVLAGLRFPPSKLGYSPYLIAFKQEVCWIGDIVGPAGPDIDDSLDSLSLGALVGCYGSTYPH